MEQIYPWDLRELCQKQHTKWSSQPFTSDAEALWTGGRLQVLETTMAHFADRIASAADLRKRVDALLDQFAEEKCRQILETKQSPLSAQSVGGLLQIHELVPQIWSLCSTRWRNTNKRYRHLFRVYQRRNRWETANWRGSQRAEQYQEVAIVRVPLVEDTPHWVWKLTCDWPGQWRQRSEALWVSEHCDRGTTYGDVIVSLLSGESWAVDGLRGMTLATVGGGEHPLVLRQALRGCEILTASAKAGAGDEGGEQGEVWCFFRYLNIEPQWSGEHYKLSYPQFELLRTVDLELAPACPWYHEDEKNRE